MRQIAKIFCYILIEVIDSNSIRDLHPFIDNESKYAEYQQIGVTNLEKKGAGKRNFNWSERIKKQILAHHKRTKRCYKVKKNGKTWRCLITTIKFLQLDSSNFRPIQHAQLFLSFVNHISVEHAARQRFIRNTPTEETQKWTYNQMNTSYLSLNSITALWMAGTQTRQ